MKINLVTPAPAGSLAGNRVTAIRWERILQDLGHRVTIDPGDELDRCDLLIAMHAQRSGREIRRFRRARPDGPLVVALTGTDLYRDIQTLRPAQKSLELADWLVLLQPDGIAHLPKDVRHKARVIYQSAQAPRRPATPLSRMFEVAVVGHLRGVKDPFRAAFAARQLPKWSRVRIVQIGRAFNDSADKRARREMDTNRRYRWLGELSHEKATARLARSRLLVISSKMEGAANVASEALAARVPILASHISGLIGLLGEDYPGYFPLGDTRALTALLVRAETDRRFYRRLCTACTKRRPLVNPRRERRSWRELVAEVAVTVQ